MISWLENFTVFTGTFAQKWRHHGARAEQRAGQDLIADAIHQAAQPVEARFLISRLAGSIQL
ncbi:hypothetical protein K443DRAFT_683487 [Laccaria amethystina LaAM-08-1]|jgi:hypothetical protein|uniref:Uncharacterized protein n=1 Tax=Laccaria amethystina LaAM-08-1 TaxID=1095629 RepID=A0A0C9WJJ5_9AGAR|nr:hypothetical protein K443DRAFT_683487 [Laccaria amethystina LaAM-08-1]